MDIKSQSKLKALKELNNMMKGMMGEDVKSKMGGLKKVTVAASNDEDLKKGLNKAEELVGKKPNLEELMSEEHSDEESPEEDMMEDESMEESEDKKMSKEEILAQIEKLKAALADCE